jgi:prephenate dehydrogenase
MQIAIIGLGLIGGSIGLALKQAKWRDAKVVGYSRSPTSVPVALNIGAIDEACSSLEETVQNADIIIIATPVLTIKDILIRISSNLHPNCIVTDAASTKTQVLQWAQELLPSNINFVGGHPMAGRELSGIKAAQVDLFNNRIYCITPSPLSSPESVKLVTDMVTNLGARPLLIKPDEHDNFVAAISHLPLLLSAALVSATTIDPSWPEMSRLASTGYHDITRLASGNPEVNTDICLTNKSHIISWLDKYIQEIKRIRTLISNDTVAIENYLVDAHKARKEWLETNW